MAFNPSDSFRLQDKTVKTGKLCWLYNLLDGVYSAQCNGLASLGTVAEDLFSGFPKADQSSYFTTGREVDARAYFITARKTRELISYQGVDARAYSIKGR